MDLKNDFIKPQHPLPKEIQDMKHDETVCQFCGVSYLIHNEVKKLQDEIVRLNKELEKYEGFDKKEAELTKRLHDECAKNVELNKKRNLSQESNQAIKENLDKATLVVEDLKADNSKLKDLLQERELFISKLLERGNKIHTSLGKIKEEIQSIKTMKEILLEDVRGLNGLKDNQLLKIAENLSQVKEKHMSEKSKLIAENDELKNQSKDLEGKIEKIKMQLSTLDNTIEIKTSLESAIALKTKELDETLSDKSRLVSEKDSMADELNRIKILLSEKNRKLNDIQASLKEKENVVKKTTEERLKLEQEFKREKETIFEQLRQREIEIEKLRKSRDEEKEEISTAVIQLKALKECIDQSKKEIAVLKKEREDMIEAHQNRIKQLRESFQNKMLEADSWPKKLEEKLAEQRLKFNEEKSKLWEEMSSLFQKEIQELKEVHEKEKQDVGNREKSKTEKIKSQLETLQKRSREEILSLQTTISKSKEKHDKITLSQEALIQNLEMKIADLEKRLVELQHRNIDEDTSFKQKYLDTKRALEYIRLDFDQLEKELCSKKNEIIVLQETVRRECEERFELTDALSEARLQLLALQKKTAVNKALTIVPSPPASSARRGSADKEKRLKYSNISESSRLNSTSCTVSKEKGITFSSRLISEENTSRKRIADAVAKQRATSRTSFDSFS